MSRGQFDPSGPVKESPTRVAVLGTGGIGAAHVAAAAGLDTVELVAVADARPVAAATVAAPYGVPVVPIDALGDVADLVVVATPPVTHPDLVCGLLDAGVAVLCEKPLAIDLDGARRMAAAAHRSGALLSMASKFRFVDDLTRTRALVEAGEIGRVVKVEVVFAGQVDMSGRWNSDATVSGGGVLVDNGTHGVDVVRYLRGPIAEVFVVEGPRVQPVTVDDSVVVLLRTTGGDLAQVDVTWSYRRITPGFVTVLGSSGTVEVGWQGSRLTRGGAVEGFGTGYDKIGSLRANLADVADAVRTGRPPRVDLDDALASVSVLDAAHRSMASGAWEKVEVTP